MLISSLTQRSQPIDDGLGFLRREFAPWGVDLWDGNVLNTDYVMGRWTWLTVDEAAERFPGAPWLTVHSGCPFVGPTVGYLLIDDLHPLDDGWVDVLFPPLLKEGRGILASTGTGAFHVAVTKQRFRLNHAIGKCALDDGAMLLERDWGPYQEAVSAEFDRALEAAGWHGDPPVCWMPTAHNSWRWNPPGMGVEAELELMDRFGHLEVDLWLYDFEAEWLVADPNEAG